MTLMERKLLVRTAWLGVLLTAVVVAADALGLLVTLERSLYDQRCRVAQFYTPQPTDRLVHLDITDLDLQTIGSWPWPRTKVAIILDELRAAGAQAVAFDVIFSEPQLPHMEREQPGKPPVEVDDDARFVAAVERFGKVLIPISFVLRDPPTLLQAAAIDLLKQDLEMEPAQLVDQLVSQGHIEPEKVPHFRMQGQDLLVSARRVAMYACVDRELNQGPLTLPQMRQRLLPKTPATISNSPQTRLLGETYDEVLSLHQLREMVPRSPHLGINTVPVKADLPPIYPLAKAAASTGFVYYLQSDDGVVRYVPLWLEEHDHYFPQLGLALACSLLDVPLADIAINPQGMVIPRANGPAIAIPTGSEYVSRWETNGQLIIDVPWFGGQNWEDIYQQRFPWLRFLPLLDDDAQRRAGFLPQPRQHLPISDVWQLHEIRERLRGNCGNADDAIGNILTSLDLEKALVFAKEAPTWAGDDVEARLPWLETAVRLAQEAQKDDFWRPYLEGDPAELGEEGLKFRQSVHVCAPLLKEIRQLVQQYHGARGRLHTAVMGRAVVIASTATGAADFVVTSLYPRCPGSIVHGLVFNAVLTGDFWRRTPFLAVVLVSLFMGLLTTLATAFLSPMRSLLTALGIIALYLAFNFIILFDRNNLIVGVAGPLVAVGVVWAGCQLDRFIVERRERARITKRFSSYADPVLVNHILEHPEKENMEGEEKELTVVFTDLAGFTTISEKLGRGTVGLLSEYFGLVVPLIRQHNGYVNKFLGDGVMFFYGAPDDNLKMASDAVNTVLAMQEVLETFNHRLDERGLPNVRMRAGLATGLVVVGDAGIEARRDYTVVGDIANLAARLESGNKYTGTWTMVNERTRELIGDQFLVRPVGRLQVVGKSQWVMTYEPIAPMSQATPQQQRLAQLTNAMVGAFQTARFQDCLRHVEELEEAFGHSKLGDLYRKLAKQYVTAGAEASFEGMIVLESK